MNIKVTKLTNVDLLHKSNLFTTGKESYMTLKTCYRNGHSNMRTQLFVIALEDVPLFVASQLVRSKAGVEWWQKSRRPDRGEKDFHDVCAGISLDLHLMDEDKLLDGRTKIELEERIYDLPDCFDRYAPTSLMGLMNAEAIINMSRKRLCAKASKETREIWQKVCELIEECDPDLYPHLVPPCVATGVCREAKSCEYIRTEKGIEARKNYKDLFR